MTGCETSSVSLASLVVPHSLTWFKSSPTACSPWFNDEGCDIAFMSYEFLCIFRLCSDSSVTDNGYCFVFLAQFKAHEQNVNSVSFPVQFLDSSLGKCFITCGNDRYIRVWSYLSKTYSLDKEINLGQDIVPNTCAACYISGCLYILSASLTGHVVIWEPLSPHLARKPLIKKFVKDSASSCVWTLTADHPTQILAIVGYESGDICGYLYDRSSSANKNLELFFRKSAHRFDICSLVAVSELENGYGFFASAGRDGDVKLWSIADCQCKYSHHFRTYQKGTMNPQEPVTSKGKAWISLAPTSHTTPRLLAFDPKGNLHAFNCVDKPLLCDTSSSPRHTGIVFSLMAIPNSSNLFISFGMDLQIIVWKTTDSDWYTFRPVANHVCLSSKINTLCQGLGFCSPLAVGLSDGNLLLLNNVQPPAPNSFLSITRFSPLPPSGAAVGISALAWHPDPQFEHLLAIGSSKGYVDIVDVRKPQRRGRNFNQLEGCVYRVAWGPPLFEPQSTSGEEADGASAGGRLFVHAVANGSLFLLLSLKKPLMDLGPEFSPLLTNLADRKLADIAFRQLNEEKELKFSWLVALGSMNGAVNIFGLPHSNEPILPLSRVDIHKKCIISMMWSHHIDKYLLAVGSCESSIVIVDATEQARGDHLDSQPLQSTSCFAILQGHGARIPSLAWSPCDFDLLLSGSYDCTATVWRIELGASTAIANYRNHLSRVFACVWSPHDPDFVLSGEEYGYLVGWRPSAQTIAAPPPYRKHRNPCGKIPNCQTNVEEVTQRDTLPESELMDPIPPKRSEPCVSRKPPLLPSLFATPSFTDCSMPVLASSPPVKMCSRLSVVLDFVSFMRDPSTVPEERILPEFDLLCSHGFSRRRQLVRFTEAEALKHFSISSSGSNKQSRLDAYFTLLLWLGRADLVATKCIELQHMPFWLMWALELMLKGFARASKSCLVEGEVPPDAIAPDDFLKHKVIQLRASNEYVWASTLLVCAGQTAEAVRLLLQCGRAKEALLLFRLRLSPEANPDLLGKCLNLLAQRLAHTGLPNSALAFLAARQMEQAATVVRNSASISDPPIDHIVALWTTLAILPDSLSVSVKLAYYSIIYAANLSLEEECRLFLRRWRAALPAESNANYLLNCAEFLLLGEWTEPTIFPAPDLVRFTSDRQPSLEEAECVASVVMDFAAACLNEDLKSLQKSLTILKENHPATYNGLVQRILLKTDDESIPQRFRQICHSFK